MSGRSGPVFDEINYWSEIKLDIIEKYAAAYSRILSSPDRAYIHHSYVDAFSGPGFARSKSTNALVLGSPLLALAVRPPFERYYLIDLDESRASALDSVAEQALSQLPDPKPSVVVRTGNCNRVLREEVFPTLGYKEYQRALCVLDPYGLDLDWDVIEAAGQLGTVEIFLNFPIIDMNRNALWSRPERVSQAAKARMTAFWGDESWAQTAYEQELTLFGDQARKLSNEDVAEAFRRRLVAKAGFKHVPQPIPMRNSMNATVYYLFFGAQKPVAGKIVEDIFNRYRNRRG